MIKKALVMVAMAGMLAGCENMSPGQKGAGARRLPWGRASAWSPGGSFGPVVGAGLIGGAVGYVGGSCRRQQVEGSIRP